MSPLNFLEGSI